MSNYRVFLQKRKSFRQENTHWKQQLAYELNITRISNVNIYTVYDLVNATEQQQNLLLHQILKDAVSDQVVQFSEIEQGFNLAFEPLPGQFDQRADSAKQCLQLLTINSNKVQISTANLFVIQGQLTEKDKETITKYLLNPVEARIKNLTIPPQAVALPAPTKVPTLYQFNTLANNDLSTLKSELSLAMSLEDLQFTQNYFGSIKRNPTETELKLLDTYWSDHCRHTTFLTEITDVSFPETFIGKKMEEVYNKYIGKRKQVYGARIAQKPICLMDMATIAAKDLKQRGLLNDLEVSEEINACSVRINVEKTDGSKEPWLLMFKNETHNHPTEIEPFGGASTCLGGAIRDPLSGRAYVYQAVRVSGAANPFESIADTLPGKLPQRKITTEAAQGFSSYGNQIGVAGTQVAEIYHPGYKAKRMEVGAVVGAVKEEYVRRESPVAGDMVLLLGGRTGRDGVGGATGSSKEHTEESLATAGAEVQKGNAPEERKIQRLFRNPAVLRLIKKCNDFGAGGVSVAVGELADGLDINLDAVPLKYAGLNGTEIALSESQERMAVVIEAKDVQTFKALAKEENIECTLIAQVTNKDKLTMTWQGNTIVDIDRTFLDSNGVRQETKVEIAVSELAPAGVAILSKETWLAQLARLNHCSQQGLHEMFDGTVGGTTVFMPFGGKHQLSPQEGSLQKIPVLDGDTTTASAMTWGFDPELSSQSPFLGGANAVIESLTKIVAMGGDVTKVRLSFQEYFRKLGNDPKNWGLPFQALLGTLYVQDAFNIAAIGGKDSMSGTFNDIHVPPTLISFAVTTIDTNKAVSAEFKNAGTNIYLLKHTPLANGLPNNEQLIQNFNQFTTWVDEGKIESAATIKRGGLLRSLSQMAFGNKLGFEVSTNLNCTRPDYGSLVFESKEELQHNNLVKLGVTKNEFIFSINDITVDGNAALAAWQGTLESIFPIKVRKLELEFNTSNHIETAALISAPLNSPLSNFSPHNVGGTSARQGGKPQVTISVFPGTNCEYESKLAFERAGANAQFSVFKNITKTAIDASVTALAAAIDNSQIYMIPGGFSAGDEPDGSGKFITAVLRNTQVQDAIYGLLERDGLVIGICNGFQALVKSGLLPFSKIGEVNENSATLTHNEIGRHISQIVKTKVVNNFSPWLAGFKIGATHNIAVSHGEGRFVASEATIKILIENGQIATQYVTLEGEPTLNRPCNPNGSYHAIEGITDSSGKILGKMGHGERYGLNCYKNVPGNKYQALFENGVNYFK